MRRSIKHALITGTAIALMGLTTTFSTRTTPSNARVIIPYTPVPALKAQGIRRFTPETQDYKDVKTKAWKSKSHEELELNDQYESAIYHSCLIKNNGGDSTYGHDHWESAAEVHELKESDCDGVAISAAAIGKRTGHPAYILWMKREGEHKSHLTYIYGENNKHEEEHDTDPQLHLRSYEGYGSIANNREDTWAGGEEQPLMGTLDSLVAYLAQRTGKEPYTHYAVFEYLDDSIINERRNHRYTNNKEDIIELLKRTTTP